MFLLDLGSDRSRSQIQYIPLSLNLVTGTGLIGLSNKTNTTTIS